MTRESPLDIMRGDSERMVRRGRAPVRPPRRGYLRIVVPLGLLIGLAIAWCGVWYYAAAQANRTVAAWMASEAAAGRVYSCGSEGIAGFPFSIQVRCVQAAAAFKTNLPPFDLAAKDITFTAQIWRPTVLVGDVVGPVTVAELCRRLDERAHAGQRPAAQCPSALDQCRPSAPRSRRRRRWRRLVHRRRRAAR